jgi:hypothetical protein
MMIATTIMATLMASVVVVMRSGYAVWNAQEDDLDVLENGYGVLRHFSQQLRQATSVATITDPSNTSGSLAVVAASGATKTWTHNAGQKEITFNNGTSSGLLAKNINSVTYTGYKADGTTQTTTVADIQVVKCSVQVTLPRGAGVTRTVSTRAWIRSW